MANAGRRALRAWCAGCALVSALVLTLSGCAQPVSTLTATMPVCPDVKGAGTPITWMAPAGRADLERSRKACESLGPVVVQAIGRERTEPPSGAVFVVSWNVAIGSGQVNGLMTLLRTEERQANRPDPEFILLLQEAIRDAEGSPDSVLSLSAQFGMDAVYIPSMANAGAGAAAGARDRGNAILSTLPLHDLMAVELPFVRQRRVAIAAAVDVNGLDLTVVSVHLSTRESLLRGSLFSAPHARGRQASAMLAALGSLRRSGPIIVGGDFNTFAGSGEPAIRLMQQRFARIACGSPITHQWGLSLDYLFSTETSIVEDCGRLRNRYGSDHHPLVARLERAAFYAAPDRAASRRSSPMSARSFHASAIQ